MLDSMPSFSVEYVLECASGCTEISLGLMLIEYSWNIEAFIT